MRLRIRFRHPSTACQNTRRPFSRTSSDIRSKRKRAFG
nr:MAG TPA: hypothetical protein [Caudoviricetes sp.]